MRVLIAGGTGMVGKALLRSLLTDGHRVLVLTRDPQNARLPQGVQAVEWDGCTAQGWGRLAGQVDAIVNLAGERLARWPWTAARKKRFWESRVNAGQAITEAVQVGSTRPKVVIQASGINYYGPRGKEAITEADTAGADFLAKLSQVWEASTEPVEALGVRRAIIRSAIILDADDGILPIMAIPIRWFIGGPLGLGRQGLPWIHIDDEIAAIRFLIENTEASGPFNLTSPMPISSAEFLRQLARVLHRPYWLPVPAFALRFLLGEMSTLLLIGQYAQPERLLKLGFHFQYEYLNQALENLLQN